MKKILIAAPTASAKKYCDREWVDNIMLTEYDNFTIRLFDNTKDNGEYSKSLNDYYISKYGNDGRFECVKIDTFGLQDSIIARVCKGHNMARDYALANGFDYLWHVESDIMPKNNVLQELIIHNKPIVGALYYRDFGRHRRLMVQFRKFRSHNNIYTTNADIYDDIDFVDGTLKEAAHIGLGCVLIRRDVLEKIPFRYVPGVEIFPDSFFAEDTYKHKYKIWADTSLICLHQNENWQLNVYNKDNKW